MRLYDTTDYKYLHLANTYAKFQFRSLNQYAINNLS